MNFRVEYSHVSILFVSVHEQSAFIGEWAFHVPFHVSLGLKQFQVTIVKKTYVEIIFFLISYSSIIDVGEPDE